MKLSIAKFSRLTAWKPVLSRAACLAQLLAGASAVFAQPGEPPPPVTTTYTNRLDLDLDGTVDFEIVEQEVTTFIVDFGAWTRSISTTINLVPLGGSRLLVSDAWDMFKGNLPTLATGDLIGEAPPGTHWLAGERLLVSYDPRGPVLYGPVAELWVGSPQRIYLAITLGDATSPVYGWLCFRRERGSTQPYNWGYARQPNTAVKAGDPDTAPPLTLSIVRSGDPGLLRVSWQPNVAGLIFEEGIAAPTITWQPSPDPINQEFFFPETIGSPGEIHLFRARLAP